MKPFDFIAAKPAAIALALLVGAGLSGCGSSDNDHGNNGGGNTTPAPVPMIDAFFAAVSGVVSASSDASEPNSIEAPAATSPENTEPEPLG